MKRARDRWLAGIGFVLLLALHLDSWRPQRLELYFGWMPEELLYRLVWMLGAWGYLAFVVARVWKTPPQEPRKGAVE